MSHVVFMGAVASLLEDRHIAFNVEIFGHADIGLLGLQSYPVRPPWVPVPLSGADQLSQYDTIILPLVDCISDSQVSILSEFSKRGGSIIWFGSDSCGTHDEEMRLRKQQLTTPGSIDVSVAAVSEYMHATDDSVAIALGDKLVGRMGIRPSVNAVGLPPQARLSAYRHNNATMMTAHVINYNLTSGLDGVATLPTFTLRMPCRSDCESYRNRNATLHRPGRLTAVLAATVNLVAGTVSIEVEETHSTNITWMLVSIAAFDQELALASETASMQTNYGRLRLAMNAECLSGLNDTIAFQNKGFEDDISLAVHSRNGWGPAPTNETGFTARAMEVKTKKAALASRTASIHTLVTGLQALSVDSVINADCDMKFNLGGPVLSTKWLSLQADNIYTVNRGYGWESGQSAMRIDRDPQDSDTVFDTALSSAVPAVLRIDHLVPSAPYVVTVVVGTYTTERTTPVQPCSISEVAILSDTHEILEQAYGVIPDAGKGLFHHVALNATASGRGVLRLRLGAVGGSMGPLFGGAVDLWRATAVLVQSASQQPTPRATARLVQARQWSTSALREGWHVVGPFPDQNCTAMSWLSAKAASGNLSTVFRSVTGGLLRWKPLPTLRGSAPRIDFGLLLSENNRSQQQQRAEQRATFFAATRIFSPVKTAVTVHGSMTGAGRLWLKGKAVVDVAGFAHDVVAAGLTGDEWSFATELHAGWNTITLESIQWVSPRLGGSAGRPPAWAAWVGIQQ
jgi:hypothetical protein